ncbi:MAG TPA: 2-oxoglutarate dehydrogenase, E2 component, dihydrolipoamide succinyltransferase [Actinomycetota bacterium]|nr:2-oxoglutarate dehydrogenase, E2 component, dihydrolipoamide succinyltransferase [Actinomycetota bacterium]
MQVKMPQLGETVVEGTILKWLKHEGDQVAQDEALFEISTDKVDTEVPSPAAGTLTQILVPEGQTVAVGTDLATIDSGDGAAAAQPEAAKEEPAPSEADSGTASATPVPESAPAETPQAEPAAAVPAAQAPSQPTPSPKTASTEPAAAQADQGPRSQILSPLVRRLADEHQVDLGQIQGTGTGGRITKNDILAFVASRGEAAPAAAPPATAAPATAPAPAPSAPAPAAPLRAPTAGQGEEVVPITHIRKRIAEHMLGSTQTTARAWTLVEVNVDHLVKIRERAKDAFRQKYGVNLTYLPFVVRATVDALLEYPYVNARLDGESIVLHRYVNMGIAVSYDAGLIVPVIKGADGMNSVGIARAIADLAERARAHQLKPDEVQGATFTITNPGPYGSVASVPIISTPNTGILSFDAITKRPVVIDDAIAVRSMVNISMSWDHRVIDGEVATRFLSRVKNNLESWDFAEDIGV